MRRDRRCRLIDGRIEPDPGHGALVVADVFRGAGGMIRSTRSAPVGRCLMGVGMRIGCPTRVNLPFGSGVAEVDGEGRPAADLGGVELGVVGVDLPLGEALEDLVDGDPRLEPGERCAEAEVDAVAEGEVALDRSVDVEGVAVGRNTRLSRLAEPRISIMALPAGTVWPWSSTSRVTYRQVWSPGGWYRRISSAALAMSERSSTSSRRWSGWSARILPLRPMTRLVVSLPAVARTLRKMSSSSRVRRRIVPVSSSNSAWMSAVIRSSAGCLGPPVDELLEEGVLGELPVAELARLAFFASQLVVLVDADVLLVLLRDAEQHADHLHRHLGAEVGHEVQPVAPDERVEHLGAIARGSGARGPASSSA